MPPLHIRACVGLIFYQIKIKFLSFHDCGRVARRCRGPVVPFRVRRRPLSTHSFLRSEHADASPDTGGDGGVASSQGNA